MKSVLLGGEGGGLMASMSDWVSKVRGLKPDRCRVVSLCKTRELSLVLVNIKEGVAASRVQA